MFNFYKFNISFISAICILTFPLLYSAKTMAVESEITDEVVVTARKREESEKSEERDCTSRLYFSLSQLIIIQV